MYVSVFASDITGEGPTPTSAAGKRKESTHPPTHGGEGPRKRPLRTQLQREKEEGKGVDKGQLAPVHIWRSETVHVCACVRVCERETFSFSCACVLSRAPSQTRALSREHACARALSLSLSLSLSCAGSLSSFVLSLSHPFLSLSLFLSLSCACSLYRSRSLSVFFLRFLLGV